MNFSGGRKWYLRELGILLIIALATFVACALYSYNPTDISWTFYSTRPAAHAANWCGICGAQCAALCIYFLGCAAYMICVLLAGLAYEYMRHSERSMLDTPPYEWDRSVACVAMLCIMAALCNLHGVGDPAAAGGLIGIGIVEVLYPWCNGIGTALLLYVLGFSCFLIISRLSFMRVMCMTIRALAYIAIIVYQRVSALRIIYRVGTYVRTASRAVARCISLTGKTLYDMLSRWVWMVLDGSLFDHTFLRAPRLKQCEHCEVIVTEDDYRASHMHHDVVADVPYDDEQLSAPFDDTYTCEREKNALTGQKSENNGCQRDEEERVKTHTLPDQEHEGKRDSKSDSAAHESRPYALPPISFFMRGVAALPDAAFVQECETRAQMLQEKLARFGIQGKVTAITRGPVVTLFEYQPQVDVKLSKIMSLEDDLAMALKALSIRIIAPIPGRSVVGFEIANISRTDVLLAESIHSSEYQHQTKALPLILGQDTVGRTVVVDLARMPHLLVAGSTGSGKSVGLNSMLISLLCTHSPDELKLILIDPKRLEFTPYEDIAHLLFPIITHTKTAVPVLKWVASHMDERYEKMAACGARNIFDYNKQYEQGTISERMPFIVIIIDELADLMITVGREVEDAIARITQMARAAGIHLIVATQRPSVDVITGLIKVNFPSRISFRVTSRVDSRTILDCGGADKLLGRGDMLFLDAATSLVQRVHGAYVSDTEIKSVTDHIRAERSVQYLDIVTELQKGQDVLEEKDDIIYAQVLEFLDEVDALSISLLQRKFKIGYNRSARIIDQLEASGRIMPADGGKQRRIIK